MKKKYGILLFSFLFAFALWLYIELNISYSIDLSIPVEVQSVKTQGIAEEVPSSIDVKLKGKGWDLLNIMISKDLVYTLDVSKLKRDSRVITSQFVTERLNLNPNVSIISISPDTININFDKVSEKIIPIRNNIEVVLRAGYRIVGEPLLEPDSVRVQGASFLINKIRSIPTEDKRITGVNSDIEGIVRLKDTLQNLIKANVSEVRYFYKIQLSAEKDFEELPVEVLNIPEDKEVLLLPPNIKVSLRGGVEQLSQLSPNDIKVNVEFGRIENDTLGFIIPEIEIPSDMDILNIDPPRLQYIIKSKS